MPLKNICRSLILLFLLFNESFSVDKEKDGELKPLIIKYREGESLPLGRDEDVLSEHNYGKFGSQIFSSLVQIPLFFNIMFSEKYTEDTHLGKSSIEELPLEILLSVAKYLNVTSIFNYSHTCTHMSILFNDNFWRQYNFDHNFENFELEDAYCFSWCIKSSLALSPAAIALANHYYQEGIRIKKESLIHKSSRLGFPKAKAYFQNKKTMTQRYYRSPTAPHVPMDIFFFYKHMH